MILTLWIILYLFFAFLFFRATSIHCVMACASYTDYSFMQFVRSLFFPITIIVMVISGIIENKRYSKEEQFERFKDKKLKEYGNLVLINGKIKKISQSTSGEKE